MASEAALDLEAFGIDGNLVRRRLAPPRPLPVSLPSVDLGRTSVAACTLAEATEAVISEALTGTTAQLVVTANLQHLRTIAEDADFATAYERSFLRVADGAPVLKLAAMAGRELPERVAGSDLVPALCSRAAELGLTVQFVGGAHGVADRASAVVRRDYPGIRTAKPLCPPWGFHLDPVQDALLVSQLRAGGADLVFVCLGAPKQEKWVSQHLDELPQAVFIGAGATVDFIAGTVERAPEFWQKWGLEWAYRLGSEPRRLGGRYLRDLLAVPRLMLAARRARPRNAHAAS